ncbi:DMT family transporter [Vibrio quintilis]|nr:DMT family transporter [Vibrio quintilis]
MNIIYLVIALLAGAGMSVQAAVNSRLSSGIGDQPVVAALISFLVGSLCLAVIAGLLSDWQQVTTSLGQQPLWRWLGGAIGAGIVFTSVLLAQKLGVANTMFLFIVGQLVTGMAIDHFGLIQMSVRPAHWWKFAGMGLMMCGLILFTFGHRWFDK